MMVGGGLPIIACMNVNLDDVMCDIANDDQARNLSFMSNGTEVLCGQVYNVYIQS